MGNRLVASGARSRLRGGEESGLLEKARKPSRAREKRKIFLVDDHPVVRKGLADLINQEHDLTVLGEAESVEEALRLLRSLTPDLVIADVSLAGTDGIGLVKDLTIRHPEIPVLVLSMHDETLYAERALRAGAKGYIMKQEATSDLQTAIRRVLKGEVYLSERMSQRLLSQVGRGQVTRDAGSLERLSDRELEVFNLIGRGLGTSEIARQLHLSVKTIETYRAHLKAKLNVKTATELVQRAVHWVSKL